MTEYEGFTPQPHSRFARPNMRRMKSFHYFSSPSPATGAGDNLRIKRQCPSLERLRNIYPGGAGVALIRYICLVYDKDTPFRDTYRVIATLKDAVARYCGFSGSDIDKLKMLKGHHIVDALSEFLRYQNNRVWDRIVQNEEVYYGNQLQILQHVDLDGKDTDRMRASENKAKLLASQDQIAARLDALYAEFTGSDPFAEEEIKLRRAMTPEAIAGHEDFEDYVWPYEEEE